jgi:hypothetical protein
MGKPMVKLLNWFHSIEVSVDDALATGVWEGFCDKFPAGLFLAG